MKETTFEVGFAYTYYHSNLFHYIIADMADYGCSVNDSGRFPSVYYDMDNDLIGSSSLGTCIFEHYEKCIVEDLSIGDKVLLRCGSIGLVKPGCFVESFRVEFGEHYFSQIYKTDGKEHGRKQELGKHDVIAILEPAQPEALKRLETLVEGLFTGMDNALIALSKNRLEPGAYVIPKGCAIVINTVGDELEIKVTRSFQ